MGLIDKLKGFGVGMIVGRILKGTAEGKYGGPPQWLYLHLNGLITVIGVALIGLGAAIAGLDHLGLCALVGLDCATWASTVAKGSAYLGTFIAWIGTVNGGVKLDPPDPAKLAAAIASLEK